MRLDSFLDLFRGRAVTIPPMDGALRPDTALDDAAMVVEAAAPDNLCRAGDRVLFSSGPEVLALPAAAGGKSVAIARFDAAVSALAAAPDGTLAVGLDDGRVVLHGGAQGRELASQDGAACPTALAFLDETTLFVCHGSDRHRPSDWVVDLMERNAGGSVWRIDPSTGAQACLARDLAFPYGILVDRARNRLVVSESWRHRLVAIPLSGGAPETVLAKLPGYPARLAPAGDGGAWLALFAPRNRLIEFVLLEEEYRIDMMREIPREFWIAPALSSGAAFLEPLQCGGVKTMGIHKPWSPTRSYGLVARLDRDMQPVSGFHSRADGSRHGIASVLELPHSVLAASKGGNLILSLDDR